MYNYCMLSLFGLVLNLRHVNLFPGEELPDASSVVLISQSVQEDIEGGRGLGQDGSHHPELGRDQVGVLHSSVESQDTIGAPAEQHSLKRSVGVEPGVSSLLEFLCNGLVRGHDNKHLDGHVKDAHGDQVGHVVSVSLAVVQSAAGPQGLVVVLSPADERHGRPEGGE